MDFKWPLIIFSFTFSEKDWCNGNESDLGETYTNLAINAHSANFVHLFHPNIEKHSAIQRLHVNIPRGRRSNLYAKCKSPEQLNCMKIQLCEKYDPSRTDPNRCYICGISFRYDSQYMKHNREEHGNVTPYECGDCGSKFGLKSNLKNHERKYHDKNNNDEKKVGKKQREARRCDTCHISFKEWKAFEKHALTQHPNDHMMACSHCPKKFHRRRQKLRHEMEKHTHSNLKCAFCNVIFERSDILKNHMEHCEDRQMKKFKGSNKVAIIQNRPQNEGGNCCDECGEIFDSFAKLKRHARLEHGQNKFHFCDYCDKAFTTRPFLDKHVDMLHPEERAYLQSSRKYIRRGSVYMCDYCQEEFKGVSAYENHGKQHPGRVMFYCDCGKGFAHLRSLRIHAKESHGDDKTCCLYCTKCFYSYAYLKEHEKSCRKRKEREERLKSKEDLYCQSCRKYFQKHSTFKRHRYKCQEYERCNICNEGFHKIRNPDGLARHVEARHPLRENIRALVQTLEENQAVKLENNFTSQPAVKSEDTHFEKVKREF